MVAIQVDGLRNPVQNFPVEFLKISYFHFSFAQENVLRLENFHGREKNHSYIPNRLLIFRGKKILCTPGFFKTIKSRKTL